MKEDLNQIREELKSNVDIPLHLRHAEINARISETSIEPDRMACLEKDSLQTEACIIYPYRKHISQLS